MYIALAQGHAPNAGWFDYVPLASKTYTPSINIDYYGWGLIFNGIASTATSINFIVTIFKLRAPGMSLNRMPLFCYAFLAVSFALLFALPSLSVAALFLELRPPARLPVLRSPPTAATRSYGKTSSGSSATPRSTSSSCPRSGSQRRSSPPSRKRKMVFFPLVALSEILVAFLGFGVWVHHMFTVGYPTVTTVLLRRRQPDHRDPFGDPAVRLDRHDHERDARSSRRRCCSSSVSSSSSSSAAYRG